jgi:hypothetical protein
LQRNAVEPRRNKNLAVKSRDRFSLHPLARVARLRPKYEHAFCARKLALDRFVEVFARDQRGIPPSAEARFVQRLRKRVGNRAIFTLV